MKLYHPLFRHAIPNEATFLPTDATEKDAKDALDVAFSWFSFDDGNAVAEFRLTFLLKSLNLGDGERGEPLFGRVVYGREFLEKLSDSKLKKKGDLEMSIAYEQL